LGRTEAEAESIIRARREDAEAQASLDAEGQAKLMGAQTGGVEGGIGAPQSPEDAGAPEEDDGGQAAAQESKSMKKRLDALAESLDVQLITAKRMEKNLKRLPVELRRMVASRGR
jgi:hypothetical protein